MDKQKQIEEMATEIARTILSCPLNQGRHCDVCKFNDKDTISYDCQSYLVAEKLLEKYQPKIPEIPKNTVLTDDDIAELLTIVAKDTRKETAEKFARLVEFHSVSTRDEEGREIFTISALGLQEILHEEFGVPYDEICSNITEGKNE